MQSPKLLSLNWNFFPLRCNYTPQKFVMFNCFLSSLTLKLKALLPFETSTVIVRRHSVISHTTESPSSGEFIVIDCELADFILVRSSQLQRQPVSRTAVPSLVSYLHLQCQKSWHTSYCGWRSVSQCVMESRPCWTPWPEFCLTFSRLMTYIYIYIQGVTGGTDQTSGGCSLC